LLDSSFFKKDAKPVQPFLQAWAISSNQQTIKIKNRLRIDGYQFTF